MAAIETANAYVNGLTIEEFRELKSKMEKSEHFYKFLTTPPCSDVVTMATFSIECTNCGIPKEYTINDTALHYLVKAINERACRNG